MDSLILPATVRVVEIPELSEAIAFEGLIVPLTVRPTDQGFLVVAGTRRLLAIRMLVDHRINCLGEGYSVVPAPERFALVPVVVA